MGFTCKHPACGRSYLRKEHLTRHAKVHDAARAFACPTCDAKFTRGYTHLALLLLPACAASRLTLAAQCHNVQARGGLPKRVNRIKNITDGFLCYFPVSDTLRRHMRLHGPRASPPAPGRVSRACRSCHGSKTRCDGVAPSCTPCADRGRPCTYPATLTVASQPGPVPSGEPDSDKRPAVCVHFGEASPPAAPIGAAASVATSNTISEQLLDVFFGQFHCSWPVVRRHTVTGRPQPMNLLRAIETIALFFCGAPESRIGAVEAHDKLLAEAQHEASTLLAQARTGEVSTPTEDLLPHLQFILLSLILCAYRPDQSIDIPLEMRGVIMELFKLVGVYDQSRISAAIPLHRDDYYPLLARDSYQSLLHTWRADGLPVGNMLHLLLNIRIIDVFPWKKFDHSLDPSILDRVLIGVLWSVLSILPIKLLGFGRVSSGTIATVQLSALMIWRHLTISALAAWMTGSAGRGGRPATLPLAFLAFDKYLALAVRCWCARVEGEPDVSGTISALN
ncbi:hypothetical protein MAPG_06260 [Magnaporthiopsis poae ATCC 64411]|uniref:Zn(2)-C6 fungal-type domain-containing protein n=1 Tax=Magnaporthiopsis poae (strain ATCC 64411 / 73-15) TaxID=644358 RepID=A0A0C4E1J6_MAGP6|nr:hypothetical protein MAPG_06260 [Magnaporthiopsis poae ATCC 64411]